METEILSALGGTEFTSTNINSNNKYCVNQISKPNLYISLKEEMRLKAKKQASHSKNLENNILSRSKPVNSTKYSTQYTLVTKRIDEMHLCSLNCNNSGDKHSPISKNVGNNFLSQSNHVNINCTDYDNSVLPSISNNIIINHDVNQTPHLVAEVSLKQSIRQQNLLANLKKSTQSTLVTKRTDEMHSNLLNCNNSSDMHSPFSKNVGNNFLSRSNPVNINYTDYDNTVLSSINNNLIVKHGVNRISKPSDISLKEMMLLKSKQQAYHFKNRSRSNLVNPNKLSTQSTLVTKRIDEMHSSSLNCNNSSDKLDPVYCHHLTVDEQPDSAASHFQTIRKI